MGACARRSASVTSLTDTSGYRRAPRRTRCLAHALTARTSNPHQASGGVVRIVAGTRKGHRIAAPKGAATRPTGDRVREAVFSIVGPVDGAAVLDLFAGSGAMGLEALSRGAASCVFVERDRAAVAAIQANLEKLRLTGAVVTNRDVAAALRDDRARGSRYDLVLVDPPYDEWERHANALAEHLPALLEDDALVVVETSDRVEPVLPLDLVTTRRYGSARITVFSQC
jgi:16S rRNA (guanine966-N2)-methyltransferase